MKFPSTFVDDRGKEGGSKSSARQIVEKERNHFCLRMYGKSGKKKAFLENGSMLLEKLIAACDRRPVSIRSFSYAELRSATNNCDPQIVLCAEGYCKWFKGSLEGRTISIKKYNRYLSSLEYVFNDIAISAKMRAHKDILKLIGCCLETQFPILVHESIASETLADRTHAFDNEVPRQQRESVHAIVFDQHVVPKSSNFFYCITIPEGEICVGVPYSGALGYLCPDYLHTSYVTEKTDVYSFGMLLLVLLTGRDAINLLHLATIDEEDTHYHVEEYMRNRQVNEILDAAIMTEAAGTGMEQLQAVLQLALVRWCGSKDEANYG
ncbi:non-functional pseudokinase ZED1-like [Carya illinoinensis]|uniref:non-functional pseudokinase ZED1-like n=1 Tax=Carya illinoinensis TaxID=32201 RepID=UPI001C71D003|nr:non-functional pseudokinase ZED1-like [Carya illinoinensis]